MKLYIFLGFLLVCLLSISKYAESHPAELLSNNKEAIESLRLVRKRRGDDEGEGYDGEGDDDEGSSEERLVRKRRGEEEGEDGDNEGGDDEGDDDEGEDDNEGDDKRQVQEKCHFIYFQQFIF
ncbi:UNVERIFIED_CONTAM: hypothetical protein RMT77_002752 [Armadillidium vulgare]